MLGRKRETEAKFGIWQRGIKQTDHVRRMLGNLAERVVCGGEGWVENQM